MATVAVEHRRRLMRAYWRSLRCIEAWYQGNREPWVDTVEQLRGQIAQNRDRPLAEGRRLVRNFEDRLEEHWLWDTYKVPATPGQGTLFMRNPPAPTHRVKYILNYGRLGYEPMIGPSYTGPLLPGEVQYRPSLPDYDVKPDANPYVTYEDQQKERHSHHHEKLPEPSQ